MSSWRSTLEVSLGLVVSLCGAVLTVQPSLATDETDEAVSNNSFPSFRSMVHPSVVPSAANPLGIRDLKRPATTVKDWQAQVEAATVQVTRIQLNRTDSGLEITLETAAGKPLQVDATQFRTEGNSVIADIPNVILALTNNQPFAAENPTADIASVRVAQQDSNSIRVSVTGKDALPTTEVILKAGGLTYSLNPEADEPDEEIVVTGEGQRGYRAPNTSVGTRTNTPLRDIPQSIQIVPQQVIEDQNVVYLEDVLRNVPGATNLSPPSFIVSSFSIRGFTLGDFSNNVLRNGLRDPRGGIGFETTNVERIEVLKGPASVLFGSGIPGGTINIVTKQPLRDPFYTIDATIGSFDFYRGEIDLSGPLNASRTVLYRLNASYQDSGSFFDLVENRGLVLAPVLGFTLGKNTKLTLEGEYLDDTRTLAYGLPTVGTVFPNPNGRIPRDLGVNENPHKTRKVGVGYDLKHEFSENWSLRNAFRAGFYRANNEFNSPIRLRSDNRTLERQLGDEDVTNDNYILATDLVGKFSTGSIGHQLLFGFELNRIDQTLRSGRSAALPFDLFNPVRGQSFGPTTRITDTATLTDALGIYVQDQITLAENLKLLLGVRFDAFEQTNQNFLRNTETSQSGDAFSPRVGIVYQPIQPISLYASYTRSFTPAIGNAFGGSTFQPERGTQYEVGLKADLNDRLSATLAFYDLTRSNVLTTDTRPGIPSGFSIQTGEQRSRGVELAIQGEILPGWNIIAGYAYSDAEITKDNRFPVGNRLSNAPENAFNVWTSYEFQKGHLKGFGGGLGFFFVGERQADLANTFQLPSYFRTDAALFYKRGQFRAQVNFRNLFNVDYFESAFGDLRVNLGQPFTVQGKISWQF